MSNLMKDMTVVERGLSWLANSTIRYANSHNLAQGGINQGYNWQEKSYPFVYSEITGYAVSAYTNAYRWTGIERYLTLAQQSADYVARVQALAQDEETAGAIFHSFSLPDLEQKHQYYSFDAAMCLQGLLDLIALGSKSELVDCARRIGNWLLERMQQDNGSFLAMYDADTNEWYHAELFGDNGCHHIKHAISLLKLGHLTDDERYIEAAERLCNWGLGLQQENGAFRATEFETQVLSHTHSYATEGFLYAHYVLGKEQYLEAAYRAGKWLLEAQNQDGSLSIAYGRKWWRMGRRITELVLPKRVTDATAQSIRIWLLLYYISDEQPFLEAADHAKDFLHKMQCSTSTDQNALGGFYFWPGNPIMFTWCTMFAVHALYALAHINREEGYQQTITELF